MPVYLNGKHLVWVNSLLFLLCINKLYTVKFFNMTFRQMSFLPRFTSSYSWANNKSLFFFLLSIAINISNYVMVYALVLIKCFIHWMVHVLSLIVVKFTLGPFPCNRCVKFIKGDLNGLFIMAQAQNLSKYKYTSIASSKYT